MLRDGRVSEVAQDEVLLDDVLDLRRGDRRRRGGTWLLGAPSAVGGDLPVGVAASLARHEAAGQNWLAGRSGGAAVRWSDGDGAGRRSVVRLAGRQAPS